jgi:hypothetical protein
VSRDQGWRARPPPVRAPVRVRGAARRPSAEPGLPRDSDTAALSLCGGARVAGLSRQPDQERCLVHRPTACEAREYGLPAEKPPAPRPRRARGARRIRGRGSDWRMQ